MAYFDYTDSPYSVRADISQAYRAYWDRLAAPGSWWNGSERVAIAQESRNALTCSFCAERKSALSPYTFAGKHDSTTDLPEHVIDAVHRIITDQNRITGTYIEKNTEIGLSKEAYVELVGIVVTVFSIDEFNRALDLPVETLPEPKPGEPDQYRPAQLDETTGFVPMIPVSGAVGPEADLWPTGRTANVVRALSAVPQCVRDWFEVGTAQYLSMEGMQNFIGLDSRSINRMQMELIAGRVSSINECFY